MGVRLAKAMGKKYVINLREGCISWGGDFEGKYVLSYSTNIFQVIEDLDSTTKNIL